MNTYTCLNGEEHTGLERWLSGKETACQCWRHGTRDTIPGSERATGAGNHNPVHYSCLKKIPWIGKLGGLQSMRSQTVRQDWATEQTSIKKTIHWNGKQCKRSILMNNVKNKWQLETVQQILHWENIEFHKLNIYICIYIYLLYIYIYYIIFAGPCDLQNLGSLTMD